MNTQMSYFCGQGLQAHQGSVTMPGGVQEMTGPGTQCHGLVGKVVTW